ncbi:MAG: glycosyltransferase family 2 protein [Bacteroidaceae bacterium]|nr:glycosyltransferase family 2 protein [Bacteroidaceae bacterium]
MKNKPLVSIIVAVYNMKEHIRQCIESVLNQSYNTLELILVDDVSNDGTADIIQEYADSDKRVTIIRHKDNSGAQIARNSGIAVSRGEYIITLDHDDYLAPDALQHAIDTFQQHEGLQCVCLREVRLCPNGTTIEHKEKNSFGLISGEEAYCRSIGWRGITGRMIVTRELQLQYPFDNCERVYGEDNTAQLQFLASPQVASCEGIYYHRLLQTSLSHKVSLNNIRGNIRFISMRQQLQQSGYNTSILQLNETAFWQSIISSCHYLHQNRQRLTPHDQREALELIRSMRAQVDMHLVHPSVKYKPGYMKMPLWCLFILQEEIYFTLRNLIKREEYTLE